MNKSFFAASLISFATCLNGQDTLQSNYPGTNQQWEKIFEGGQKIKETIYYSDNSTWMQAEYDGDVESWNWYYENGNSYFSATIVDDLIQGTYRIWYRNGQIAEEIEMTDNRENGPASFYYPSGQVAAKGKYKEGRMVGDWTFFNNEGQLFDGDWKWLFAADSAKVRMQGEVRGGKLAGKWEYRTIDRLGDGEEPRFTDVHPEKPKPIVGTYDLTVEGLKSCTNGLLEIVGEDGDFFGKITFYAKRERVYEVGLTEHVNDSLSFILPGNGGYLKIKKQGPLVSGKFKYFGVRAEIEGKRVGPPAEELMKLVAFKPLAWNTISTLQEESFPSFDVKNQLLYFTRDQKLYSSSLASASWDEPEQLPFSDDTNDSAPYVFNDGNSLLFTSNRRTSEEQATGGKKNLWRIDKTKNQWGRPQLLPNPINIDSVGDYHGAISEKGNIYYVSYNREGGFGRSDIYKGQIKNEVGEFENLGQVINTSKSESDVFIDPQEKYLLFVSTSREDGYGTDDIYISYKAGKSWSKPQNLGPAVNSFSYEYGMWVDHQNDYLYFNSYRRGTSDIYRIRLQEIELFEDYLSNK